MFCYNHSTLSYDEGPFRPYRFNWGKNHNNTKSDWAKAIMYNPIRTSGRRGAEDKDNIQVFPL